MAPPPALNWREIDAVLDELPLVGAFVRDVRQPRIRELVWELYHPHAGGRWWLLTSFHERYSRLHAVAAAPPRPTKTQRFVSFLRAHVVGGRIAEAWQLPGNRIVRLRIARANRELLMWWRLWASASNCVVTDGERRVLDALLRRPGRSEVSGGFLEVPETAPASSDDYRVRQVPGNGTLGERLAVQFAAAEEQERQFAQAALREREHRTQEERLTRLSARLDDELTATRDHERLQQQGDLILSNLAAIEPGDRWLSAADFTTGGQVEVQLQPHLSGTQNAQRYFERAREQRRRHNAAASRKRDAEQRISDIGRGLDETVGDAAASPATTTDVAVSERSEPRHAGIAARSGAFMIVVGRNARESDELLRTLARGNDTWLHCRDAPGGHVFVRAISGRSVPLETLLDAGNLAVFYSKARYSGRADVYYTHVKHLRRVRGGPAGRVIPSHERNLDIRLDQTRLDRLLADRIRR